MRTGWLSSHSVTAYIRPAAPRPTWHTLAHIGTVCYTVRHCAPVQCAILCGPVRPSPSTVRFRAVHTSPPCATLCAPLAYMCGHVWSCVPCYGLPIVPLSFGGLGVVVDQRNADSLLRGDSPPGLKDSHVVLRGRRPGGTRPRKTPGGVGRGLGPGGSGGLGRGAQLPSVGSPRAGRRRPAV